MGETFTEGAPAVAANDPANLTGPGVTQNPDNASSVFDVASIAQQNAELRAQLISENERLKSALADSRAAGISAEGLSDEDVRMIEHPEEYDSAFATIGQHSILTDKLSQLQARIDALDSGAAAARSSDYSSQAVPQPGAAQVTSDPLASQTPFSTGGAVGDSDTHGDGLAEGIPSGADAPSVSADTTTQPVTSTIDLSSLSDADLSAELARRESGEHGTGSDAGR